MSLQDELLSIERELWTGGADSYRAHMDDECLVAFTQMAGTMTREEIAASVTGGPRWRDLEMEVVGLVRPRDDVAILTYRAAATRGEAAERVREEGESEEGVGEGGVREGGGAGGDRADEGIAGRYLVLVSSGYARREGGWKMAFHQQTPLPEGGQV